MLAKKSINKRCHWKYPSSFSSLLDVRNVLVLTLTLISQGKIRSGHLLVVYVTHRLTVHQNSRHTLDITVLYHASAEVEGTQHASNIEVSISVYHHHGTGPATYMKEAKKKNTMSYMRQNVAVQLWWCTTLHI